MNQKIKKPLCVLLALCLLLGAAACGVKQGGADSTPDRGGDRSKRDAGGADMNENRSDARYVSLGEDFTDVTVTDEASALNAIRSAGGALGLADAERELKIKSVHEVDGSVFYRFQQYHEDIPVYGRSIVISADGGGAATALTANYTPIAFTPDLDNAADAAAVERAVTAYFSEEMGWEAAEPVMDEDGMDDLVIYNMGDDGRVHLARQLNVAVSTDGGGEYTVLADYNDGSVLAARPLFSEAEAEITSKDGKIAAMGTREDDGTYGVFNSEYAIAVVDLESDNSADLQSNHHVIQSDGNKFPKDAIVALKNGIDIARYFNSLGFENFYETQIWINDGWQFGVNARAIPGETENGYRAIVSMGKHTETSNLDVMAHEYTHNVTTSIVHWTEAKQAQAMNEAYSDIFGELIERYIEGWDAPDWKFTLALSSRNIAKPEQSSPPTDETADRMNLADFSHDYSTVISHAAYLMWNGIDGDPSMKLDCDKLARLWYRSLFLLQSDATFKQCSNAVIIAAKQLVQDGVLDAKQLNCVKQAFDEVGIDTDVADYRLTTNGSTIYALDVKTERSYDNYHLSIRRAQDFSLSASRTGVGESVVEVDIDDQDGYTFDLPLRPFYAQAYADYLMENQEGLGHASEYARGEGRFALAYITDDQTPELLVIAKQDTALIYTYEDGEVGNMGISEGNTDISRYDYKRIFYNEDNLFIVKGSTGRGASILEYIPSLFPGLVLTARLFESDGQYYYNSYDVQKMLKNGYTYLMDEYKDNPVSREEYEAAWHDLGLDSDAVRGIGQDEVHSIVPEVIYEVFACE